MQAPPYCKIIRNEKCAPYNHRVWPSASCASREGILVIDKTAAEIDRLSRRERPQGARLMQQTWGKLLFMHWRIDEATLRPHIPAGLTIDTFDSSAWIAVAPFTMWDVRLSFTPPVP